MRPDPWFWTQPRRIRAVGDAWRVLLFQRPSLKCLHPGLETWTEMDTAARNTRLSGRCLLCKLLERLPGERDIRTLCEYLKDAQETPLLGEIWDATTQRWHHRLSSTSDHQALDSHRSTGPWCQKMLGPTEEDGREYDHQAGKSQPGKG
ncbi:uncharacterized protein LOC112476125 isoform X2 [Pteropus alecto]|nr:uncharacterized protein LOC112476125 isoform X2 [Pteropus alecto]